MISFTQQRTVFGDLTQNTSTANLTRGSYLANIEHRYLLQKYFNNEGSFSITTIGQTDLTIASALSIGATSATLTVTWPYQSTTAYVTFSDGSVVNANFTNNSAAITWQGGLAGTQFFITGTLAIGATTATLSQSWSYPSGSYLVQFSSGEQKTAVLTNGATTMSWTGGLAGGAGNTFNTCTIATNSAASIGGVQFYNLPPNYSKLKDVTITVGNLKWTLKEIRTRQDWDNQNVFPYFANIPQNFFIYPGGDHGAQLGIWPIPSTTGNIITFNYKFRVPDLSIADQVGSGGVTLSVSNGSINVTGSGTSWTPTTNQQLESRWLQIAQPDGDNLWYQIASVNSATTLTLYEPYQGITVTNSTAWTIGQMPLLQEDFHDLLVWKPLADYFASIVIDKEKADYYLGQYQNKLRLLAEYSGSTTVDVNLSPKHQGRNPNLFPYSLQGGPLN